MAMMIELGKKATVHKGIYTIVDDEDFKDLNKYDWCAQWDRKTQSYYASRGLHHITDDKTRIQIHRQILNAQDGIHIDHKNGDTLDNRKENLRVCTNQQNQYNRGGDRGSSSQFKGVSWNKAHQNWMVRIMIDGKNKYLGSFEDEKKAAMTYDDIAKIHHGEFARLNFPEASTSYMERPK